VPDAGLLDEYCVGCHNERARVGGLALDTLSRADVSVNPGVWEAVVRKLRAGAMPPPGRLRPRVDRTSAFVSGLERTLDAAAAARPNLGSSGIHRLNRAEYANAIRDLFAVDLDVRNLLPADDANTHGFDNIADVLSVSPVLLERYLTAARMVGRLVVGETPAAVAEVYRLPRMLQQDTRMGEDLPFGSRGGLAVHHAFPVDGEYQIKVKLQGNNYDYIRGIGSPHKLEIRIDGTRVKRFTFGGEDHGTPAPASFAGAVEGNPEWEKYLHDADEHLHASVPVKAGRRLVAVYFVEDAAVVPDGILQPKQSGYPLSVNEMRDGHPLLDSMAISGPHAVSGPGDTPARQRVFVCRPTGAADEEPCAGRILSSLARRAFRRPATRADVERLFRFYVSGRPEGFDVGIQRAIERLLVDPEFLFRIERTPPGVASATVHRVSDIELASRLSFFLWSSIPDDPLLDLATQGRLGDPAELERQVGRMFRDARARRALVDNFAGQWLELRNLRGLTPDPDLFTDFDENLRDAFERETELFLDDHMRADRSVVDLLTADYTFANEQLARHYGIPNVYGERFRRVDLRTSKQPRAGLLGHGSILAVTSYPNRTSPVVRGKWLLTNVLGAPPPPPPPNVPALKDRDENGRPTSVRERLTVHRANPVCSTCHAQMDPLGFALEHYDALGRWRTTDDGGTPIDATAVLTSGEKFQGLEGLGAVLKDRREDFVRTLTEKLMTYGLGRELTAAEQPAIRRITHEAAGQDYRWSALILGIVKSMPFQMRRSAP
jgi:hypothetical protein